MQIHQEMAEISLENDMGAAILYVSSQGPRHMTIQDGRDHAISMGAAILNSALRSKNSEIKWA